MNVQALAENFSRLYRGVELDSNSADKFRKWLSQFEVPVASLPDPWSQAFRNSYVSPDGDGGHFFRWKLQRNSVIGVPTSRNVPRVGYRVPFDQLDRMPNVVLIP